MPLPANPPSWLDERDHIYFVRLAKLQIGSIVTVKGEVCSVKPF